MTDQSDAKKRSPIRRDDDLFKPTLQADPISEKDEKSEPWRVRSQLWVGFFGGSLALAVIAYLNSKRLRMNVREQRQILITGVGGFLLTCGVVYLLGQAELIDSFQSREGRLGIRIVGRTIAVIAYLVIARQQRSAERIYEFGGGEYSSLWGPGLLATFVLGPVQNLVVLWFLIR